MKRYQPLFLIMILFLFGCGSGNQEKEPNNSPQLATSVEVGVSIEGKINNGLDKDYYRFSVPSDDYYSFSVSSLKGFDTMLEVQTKSGKIIKRADDNFKNFGESLPNIFLLKGDYRLLLAPGLNDHKIGRAVVKSSPPYRIEIKKLSELTGKKGVLIEKESNDDFQTAQELKEGSFLSGYFSPFLNLTYKSPLLKKILEEVRKEIQKDFSDKDIDMYRFLVTEKGDHMLQLELSSVQDFDSTVILVDQKYLDKLSKSPNEQAALSPGEQGSLTVVDSHSFDKGEGVANFKIQGNNRYYIILSGMSRLNYRPLKNLVKSAYKIKYKILPLTSDMEVEPNNSFASAKVVESNVLKGFLNPVNDKDYYVIEGDENSFYRLDFKENNINPRIVRVYKMLSVSLIPPENLNLALDIYNQDKKLLMSLDSRKKGEPEEIPNLLMALHKKLYFVVRGGRGNDEDNYRVPYELKFYFNNKDNESMEHEPNNHPATNQGPNTFTDGIKGYINQAGDQDNYYTLIQSRGKYHFSLKGIAKATLVAELYDANNYFIKKITAKSKGADISLNYFIPKRQVLRIKVYTLEKDFFNLEQSYNLNIGLVEGQ